MTETSIDPRAGTATVTYDLPAFYCPIPPGPAHPEALALEECTLTWMTGLEFFNDPRVRTVVRDTCSHELMSRLTPDKPIELIQPAVDWAYLAFAFDDLRSDTGPTSSTTAALVDWFHGLDYACSFPQPPGASNDRFYYAAADISARMKAVTTPALWRRWITENRGTYWAGAWEATQRCTGKAASFDSYLAVRSYLGLAPATLVAAEIAAQLDVPEHERENPAVRAAIEATWLLIVIDDDLYSFPKENMAAEHAGRDLLLEPAALPILMRENNIDVRQATQMLGQIRDRVMLRAVRLSERIASGAFSSDTKTLVDLALRSVRVGLDWAKTSPRYTNPGGTSPGLIELVWADIHDTPPNTDDPLEYPSISWWWDV